MQVRVLLRGALIRRAPNGCGFLNRAEWRAEVARFLLEADSSASAAKR